MRITYEELLKRFPWLSEAQKEKLRLLYTKREAEEKDPSLKKKEFSFKWAGGLTDLKHNFTSVELQKEVLRSWSGI